MSQSLPEKRSMNIANLPVEVLNHIVVDTCLLEIEDVLSFIRTRKYFYRAFRYALFHRLALGKPTLYLQPDGSEAVPTGEYTFFPTRNYLTGERLRKFLAAVHEGVIGKDELGWVRHLAVSPEICLRRPLYDADVEPRVSNPAGDADGGEEVQEAAADTGSNIRPTYWTVSRKMCMELKNLASLHMRVLGWPKNSVSDVIQSVGPFSRFITEQRACIGLLYYFPHTTAQLDLHLETVAEVFLRQVSKHKFVRLLSLNFETVKAEDQKSIELQILTFKDLEHLRVKAMNPWSEKSMDNDMDAEPVMKMPQLNNDLPKLKRLHLVHSPNFSSLPETLEVLQIEIGEFDVVMHSCWPGMAMLPRLRKLHMVNNQVTLPRYPQNPYATPVVPVLGFTTLHTMHAEIPRPEQKVFFVPPKVLLSIAQHNPSLRHVFMPCVSKGDMEAIRQAECRSSLKTIEIQSDVMRSTMGEVGFETVDLVKLFDHPDGIPNLETLKWACGGRKSMAITPTLARAIVNKNANGVKKHSLKVVAIENRISKPISGRNDISSHPTFEEDAFSTLHRLRRSLAAGCVFVSGATNPSPVLSCCYNSASKKFHKISAEHAAGADHPNPQASSMYLDLLACLKPVKLTYPGTEDPYTFPPKDVMERGMDVEHQELTDAESEYLKRWRSMGGNFMAVTEHGKANDGRVLRDTTGIWEELFFVDLKKLELFVNSWEGSIGTTLG